MIDRLLDELRRLPGIEEQKSQWGDIPALSTKGREIFDVDRDGLLDVRVGREAIRGLDDARLLYRRSRSDWVWVRISAPDDIPFVVDLVRRAVTANSG